MYIPCAPLSLDGKMISIPVVSIEEEEVTIMTKDDPIVNLCDSNLGKSSDQSSHQILQLNKKISLLKIDNDSLTK